MASDVKAQFGGRGGGKAQTLADLMRTVQHQSAIAAPFIPRGPGDVVRPGVYRAVRHVGLDELHDYPNDHLRDALKYGMGAAQWTPPVEPSIEKYSDAEMVMEMIRRGYACMKLPADGGPPKVLRDAVD